MMRLFTCCSALLWWSFRASQSPFNLQESILRGKSVYAAHCATCHQQEGEGIEGVYPPLAQSDYLMVEKKRIIRQLLEGAAGEITVNDVVYNGIMPAFALSDKDVSDVLNYIRNSWGNQGEGITPSAVRKERLPKK